MTTVMALGLPTKSTSGAPPGDAQAMLGCWRWFQVDSPSVAGAPRVPVWSGPPLLLPSIHGCNMRCSSRYSKAAFVPLSETTVTLNVALLIFALAGIWLRSNRSKPRSRVIDPEESMTPAGRNACAPKLLSGISSNRLVSATGLSVIDSARTAATTTRRLIMRSTLKVLEFRTAAKIAPRSAKAQPFFHLEKLRSRSHSARVRKHESIDGFVRLEIPFAFCPPVKSLTRFASLHRRGPRSFRGGGHPGCRRGRASRRSETTAEVATNHKSLTLVARARAQFHRAGRAGSTAGETPAATVVGS